MIFISHKTDPDREKALYFKQELNKMGIDVWMAPESVPPGSSYAREIPSALQKCEKVLLILTEDAMRSDHVLTEIEMAKYDNKKEVIPVQFGDFSLTPEFRYLLSHVQIRRWNEDTKEEIFNLLKSSARVYDIGIRQMGDSKLAVIRGGFTDNLDYAICEKLVDPDHTVFAVGIDRTGDLSVSSTKGILHGLCQYISEHMHCGLAQLQQYVNDAKREQLHHTENGQLMEFGDCILIRVPFAQDGGKISHLQLLLVANSQKNPSYAQTGDVDDVNGIDSREIILHVFNRCAQLGEQAQTVFIGAMGTNGLNFPYEVITAEIVNAFLYAVKQNLSVKNLVYSVRNEDMERCGITSQMIYNYVRSVTSFF